MKKFLSFVLCISFCLLALPFSVFADPYTVSVLDYAVSLMVSSDSDSDSNYTTSLAEGVITEVPVPPFVGTVDQAVPMFRFSSDSFIVGAEYHFRFVLYMGLDGTFTLPTTERYAGFFSSVSGIEHSLYFNRDVYCSDLFGNADYPNPFSNFGIEDSEYYENSVLVEGTFVPDSTSGALFLYLPFLDGWHVQKVGYAYDLFYAEQEEVKLMFWDSFRQNLRDINSFLTGSLTTLLNSLHSTVSNGFTTLHNDMTALIGAIGNGLQMTEEDEQDFAEQEAENEAFNNSAAQKQEQQNQALQQQQQTNQQKQDQADELEDQRQQFEQNESDFKGAYGGSADFDSINESINQQLTGEYGGALIWWGKVFGEFFSFAPLQTMLNVSVFFGLLMLLFGVGTRAGLRVSARERRTVKHSD